MVKIDIELGYLYDNRIWNVKVSIFIDTKVSIFKGTTPAIIVYLYN